MKNFIDSEFNLNIGLFEMDAGRALVLDYMSALGGNPIASMVL